jgi:hypothetical protein
MVGKDQMRLRLNGRHMALGTGAAGCGEFVSRMSVTAGAGGVIGGELLLQRSMRRVTGPATQAAFTLPEAGAGGQQERLMTGIPGIAKVRRCPLTRQASGGSLRKNG